MADVLHYVDRLVMPYKPRAVVIYEGDNDTNNGVSPENIAGQLKEIISKIHAELPSTACMCSGEAESGPGGESGTKRKRRTPSTRRLLPVTNDCTSSTSPPPSSRQMAR